MQNSGPAWMSIGRGSGQNRAVDAAKGALSSPLLETSVEGASGVLFNVCGGQSLTLSEVNQAAEVIGKAVSPEANIIFGVVFDPRMDNEVRITLVATGFTSKRVTQVRKDEEFRKLMQSVDYEHELDVPTFIRRTQNRAGPTESRVAGQPTPRAKSNFS